VRNTGTTDTGPGEADAAAVGDVAPTIDGPDDVATEADGTDETAGDATRDSPDAD
jgi:hypothetical protein